jgi:hypothetical protein
MSVPEARRGDNMDSKVVELEDADRMAGVGRAVVLEKVGSARYDADEEVEK